ncbi:MAG: A24 family peptidase [Gammaproteobacteria bacterium]|jgi:leader peptidase (prepilin peptidase)/N-methyltransferase
MPVAELVMQFPWLLPVGGAVLGLIVGSFINVVVYRLPIMMEIAWRRETHAASENGIEVPAEIDPEKFSLWRPGSACPHCNTPITALQNIPVLSYLLLRGRCGACGGTISKRYPIVEISVGVLSAIVAWRFGLTWQGAAALALTWTLVSASIIDIDHYLLPDSLTLPLLWAGLVITAIAEPASFTDLHSSVIGAAAGYLSLWSVAKLFRLMTGKDGMGYGDFKLLAALGAWLGWQTLPLIITLSAVVGSVAGVGAIALLRRSHQQPLPFGPYLAAAGWIALLWGEDLIALYFEVML